MKLYQPISKTTLQDPFMLLTLYQLLREVQVGETLEFTVEGQTIPADFRKIFNPEQYLITLRQSAEHINHSEVVIKKRNPPAPRTPSPSSVRRCCG